MIGPGISWALGEAHRAELLRQADRYRRARPTPGRSEARAGVRSSLAAELRRALMWIRSGGRPVRVETTTSA
jgi:hypothetical protein